MFKKTRNILETTESVLLGFRAHKSHLKFVERFFFYPIIYLNLGFKDIVIKPLTVWSFVSIVIVVALLFFSKTLDISPLTLSDLIDLTFIITLFLTIFSTPSSYAFYGMDDKTVEKIKLILRDNDIATVKRLELLEQHLEMIDERTEARIKFYKTLIGVFWGLNLIFYNFQFRFATISGVRVDESWAQDFFETFIYVLLGTAAALFVMLCYRRASKIVTSCIQYACIDLKSEADTKRGQALEKDT